MWYEGRGLANPAVLTASSGVARGNGARGEPLGVLSLDAIDTRQPGKIRLSGAVNALDQDRLPT